MLKPLKTLVGDAWKRRALPALARAEDQRDRQGLAPEDPGLEKTMQAAIAWLCRAQDKSTSADGGLSRLYSLVNGWSSSYPETTGYTISTFLEYARRSGIAETRIRAERMLEWLRKIQMPAGGFQGGEIDSRPIVPVAFNTGQILLGLVSGERAFGSYREPMRRAADWLVDIQDSDGRWRQFSSPFARTGDKTYDTHTAWGLLEAARIEPRRGYAESALANIRWALTHQHQNGWFDNCCLDDAVKPLTHTLGYTLRGIVEAYRFTGDAKLLDAVRRTADALLRCLRDDGFLPGQLAPDWSIQAKWSCLTGTAQIAICWLKLFQDTGDERYWSAAIRANRFVRRTVRLNGSLDVVGAVKGSFPVGGGYCSYSYPNWAAKFLIDSLMLESDIRQNNSPKE